MVAKVLELDESVLTIAPHHSLHELIDEGVILSTCDALVTIANVEIVIQKFLNG